MTHASALTRSKRRWRSRSQGRCRHDADGGGCMRYVVGVDGGGTKTKAAVYGEEIGVVGDAETGPANYRSVGMESASTNIAQAISAAMHIADVEMSSLAGICMCIA